MNWYWLIYIPLGGLVVVGVIIATVVASKYKKAPTPSPTGTPGTTPATPPPTQPWFKKKEVGIGIGALVGVPLAMLIVFGLLIPGAAEWMADRPKMSIGIGVVVSLVVLCGLIPYKTMRGIAIFGLVATLLIGIAINIPEGAKSKWSKEASAQTTSSSSLPRSGEKVIMAPVGEWSEFFVFPLNTWWFIDQGSGKKAELRDGLGKIYRLDGTKIHDLGSENTDIRGRRFQVRSLESELIPVTFTWEPK